MRLTYPHHDRERGGMRYVYPVVSRRARGVSIGINLNPNNACNWRCVYCQVPGLVFGNAPEIDLALLREELERMLATLLDTDYMEREVPPEARRINDVALSGNGEPTSSEAFAEVVALVNEALDARGLTSEVKTVLITNGSLTHKPHVQAGLERMGAGNGEVWFKIDRATAEGQRCVNHNAADPARTLTNLEHAATRCSTWIQTCLFARSGAPPAEAELEAYLDLLGVARQRELPVRGVLLYGLARTSHQPEAPELEALPGDWMQSFAARIEAAGVPCRLSL